MNSLKPLMKLDLDSSTRLQLAVDANDPPRFYLLDHRRRVDLIAIGDAGLARELFLRRVAQQMQRRNRRERNRRGPLFRLTHLATIDGNDRGPAPTVVEGS